MAARRRDQGSMEAALQDRPMCCPAKHQVLGSCMVLLSGNVVDWERGDSLYPIARRFGSSAFIRMSQRLPINSSASSCSDYTLVDASKILETHCFHWILQFMTANILKHVPRYSSLTQRMFSYECPWLCRYTLEHPHKNYFLLPSLCLSYPIAWEGCGCILHRTIKAVDLHMLLPSSPWRLSSQ